MELPPWDEQVCHSSWFWVMGGVCTRPPLAPVLASCLGRISSCALTNCLPIVPDLRFHSVSNTGSLTPAPRLTFFDSPLLRSPRIPDGTSFSQCSPVTITTRDCRKASVQSTRPYVVNILAGGYAPEPANTTLQRDGSFLWVPDIPLGIGPHILYMTDANGYTGGVGHFVIHRFIV